MAKWDGHSTNDDGLPFWERVIGDEKSGAIVKPWREAGIHKGLNTIEVEPNPAEDVEKILLYDIRRTYGAGFPIAVVRKYDNIDWLEIYFKDDTNPTSNSRLAQYRITLKLRDIEKADAYRSAAKNSSRQWVENGVSDVKWSPDLQRYFAVLTENAMLPPLLRWSKLEPDFSDRDVQTLFSNAIRQKRLSFPGKIVSQGGISGNALGQTLDVVSPFKYTHMDIYQSTHVPGNQACQDALLHGDMSQA